MYGPKSYLLAGGLIAGSFVFAAGLMSAHGKQASVPAQPVAAAEADSPVGIAVDLNTRRSKFYAQQKTAEVSSLYTADATYIELMPVLQILKGRDQIKGHLEELVGASAVNIVPTVLSAEKEADGTLLVGGDYVVFNRDETKTTGHFVQTLREENGTWRIASHVFARPDPITADEADRYPHD